MNYKQSLFESLSDVDYAAALKTNFKDAYARSTQMMEQLMDWLDEPPVDDIHRWATVTLNDQKWSVDLAQLARNFANGQDTAVCHNNGTVPFPINDIIDALSNDIGGLNLVSEACGAVVDYAQGADKFLESIMYRFTDYTGELRNMASDLASIVSSGAGIKDKLLGILRYTGLLSSTIGEETGCDLSVATGISLIDAVGVGMTDLGMAVTQAWNTIVRVVVGGIIFLINQLPAQQIFFGATKALGMITTAWDSFNDSYDLSKAGFSDYAICNRVAINALSITQDELATIRDDVYLIIPIAGGSFYIWRDDTYVYYRFYVNPIGDDVYNTNFKTYSLATLIGYVDSQTTLDTETIFSVLANSCSHANKSYFLSDRAMGDGIYNGLRVAAVALAAAVYAPGDDDPAVGVPYNAVNGAAAVILGGTMVFDPRINLNNLQLCQILTNSLDGSVHTITDSHAVDIFSELISRVYRAKSGSVDPSTVYCPVYYYGGSLREGRFTVMTDEAMISVLGQFCLAVVVVVASIFAVKIALKMRRSAWAMDVTSQAKSWELAVSTNGLTPSDITTLRKMQRKAAILERMAQSILGFIPNSVKTLASGLSTVVQAAVSTAKGAIGDSADTMATEFTNTQNDIDQVVVLIRGPSES